jgi:hypothetical protein
MLTAHCFMIVCRVALTLRGESPWRDLTELVSLIILLISAAIPLGLSNVVCSTLFTVTYVIRSWSYKLRFCVCVAIKSEDTLKTNESNRSVAIDLLINIFKSINIIRYIFLVNSHRNELYFPSLCNYLRPLCKFHAY